MKIDKPPVCQKLLENGKKYRLISEPEAEITPEVYILKITTWSSSRNVYFVAKVILKVLKEFILFSFLFTGKP